MKFFVDITQKPFGLDYEDTGFKPCPESERIETGGYRPAFTVEIASLDDLIAFIGRHGRIIIDLVDKDGGEPFWYTATQYDSTVHPAHEIEIYNGYRE